MTTTYEYGTELAEKSHALQGTGSVSVVMGSRSDWPTMKHCCGLLEKLCIQFEYGVVSAHRTPARMVQYGRSLASREFKVIIACAGGSAHLPGMIASETTLPVLGVIPKKGDEYALGSMIKMPFGVPLATMGFDEAGAKNAALFAARMLTASDSTFSQALSDFIEDQRAAVPYTCE